MTQRDVQPWYRHFWPWFIIVLLGSSVSASLYTVYLAISTAEPVLEQPYDGR
ncbi:MAG: FixH family protein [Gammaproteobacteria bacterium]|nr:FixH family protein [Gammaproteobacteria bacterium]MDH3373100.1 FixH family protein [Gammaproteobacteria bacterium]MDH3409178.1 FixH family protein [Gammaproteobacteria bacterium]